MRRVKVTAALFALLCLPAVHPDDGAARCQTLPDPKPTAVVSITTEESGLAVFVDGARIGITPLKHVTLPAGEREVAIRLNRSDSWLDADWVEKYKLAAGDTLDIHPVFKRGYIINSRPFGAEVYLDNTLQGTTPVVVYVGTGKTGVVELKASGYESATLTIDGAGQRLWNVQLLKNAEQQLVQEDEVRSMRSRRTHFRRLAMIAGGISAASGVTAILLKRRADDLYADYLSAGDPRELEASYNKTGQYDEYAGTAFIVFQVSFGLTFYWFLRSTAE